MYFFFQFIFNLISSAGFHIIPVFVYRFIIRKSPIDSRPKAVGIAFAFSTVSIATIILLTHLMYATLEVDPPKVSPGIPDVICFSLNIFILMYKGKANSTVPNEADHWKKQYFDLYSRTQQSNQAPSLLDGLSDQEIEQVRQYAEFLKKANARPSSPPPPKSSFVGNRDSDSSPIQPSKLSEITKSDVSDEEKIQKIKQYQVSELQQTNVQYKASPKPGTTKPNDEPDIYDKVGMVIGYVLIAITIFAFFAIFVVLGG